MKNAAPLVLAITALVAGTTTSSCQSVSPPCGELSGTDAVEWSPRLRGEVEAALPARQEAFEGEPYGIEWAGDEKIAHLAMTNDITQPGALPLVTLDVNGEAVELILDTGGECRAARLRL